MLENRAGQHRASREGKARAKQCPDMAIGRGGPKGGCNESRPRSIIWYSPAVSASTESVPGVPLGAPVTVLGPS